MGRRTLMNSEKVKEIKLALECCGKNNPDCDNCPYSVGGGSLCRQPEQEALTLINELEKENKDYYDRLNNLQTYIDNHEKIWKGNTEIQLEQFAERLKEMAYKSTDWSHGEHPLVVEVDYIDEVLEEFLNK
jgi:hypothetical protein